MAPAITAGSSVDRGDRLFPWQVRKNRARFSTTPSFFKSAKPSLAYRLAARMRWALFTPMPGTRSSIS